MKLTRSRRELIIMVGNGETFTSVTVARETWICHVSIFALDTGQLRAKLYATHSLKSSLLKSCSNDPPSTHISLFILSLYLYDFLVWCCVISFSKQTVFFKSISNTLQQKWQRLLLCTPCFPGLTMETLSLAPPVATVPSSVFCSVTVSFLQPGYMHGSTHPLSFLIGLYFFSMLQVLFCMSLLLWAITIFCKGRTKYIINTRGKKK